VAEAGEEPGDDERIVELWPGLEEDGEGAREGQRDQSCHHGGLPPDLPTLDQLSPRRSTWSLAQPKRKLPTSIPAM
jgi:hypothetical protein